MRALLDPVNSRGQVLMLVLTGGRRGAGAGEDFVRARRELDELLFDEIARRRDEPDLERARGRAVDAAVRRATRTASR